MASYSLILQNDDTGATQTVFSDTVAEGETDVIEVTVENPQLAGSASQTSGN